jgi:crotonobetainyl-CoA:carnitine CoA-transferase CaiB-like acyl-CoA transferase
VPVKIIANPVKLSETPPDYRVAPPMLGEHTQQILQDLLGMSSGEIAALRKKGVV